MFGVKFASRSRSKPVDSPGVPAGVCAYAIGDIHGCAELLVPLLGYIQADAARACGAHKVVVGLGDYVDRGPDSRAVIDVLLALEACGDVEARFLLGNHESVLLRFLDDPVTGEAWLGLGGRETLASYGAPAPLAGGSPDAWRQVRDRFAASIPSDHLDFLHGLKPAFELGDYFFAHAGALPGVPLRRQAPRDLLWIRQLFLLDSRPFEKVVVHGHTPSAEVHVDERRIGLDTGAFATGVLSAVRLQGRHRRILQARREEVGGGVSIGTIDV
jgi:serine/threonine protein phosphatase 1